MAEAPPPRVTWEQVLSWRMRRQWLSETTTGRAVAVVRRLAGVQAQVPSAAAAAIALRQTTPQPNQVDRLLSDGSLMRTWAMRGTLHLLAPEDAGAYLSLLSANRTWEKGSWQRTFLSASDVDRLARVVHELLETQVLSREELVAAVTDATGDEALGEKLRSGWGALLKPLAWQGILCNGPGNSDRITFARPDAWLANWSGLPRVEQAAPIVIRAYLGAYGPASPSVFDRWLSRGVTKKATVRAWFAGLGEQLTVVDVEGEQLYARTEDVGEVARAVPTDAVRLLPAFDQYVLGPGTVETHIIAARRRPLISKAAGWISPVVVARGRVVGTWQAGRDRLDIALFAEHGDTSRDALAAEVHRVSHATGTASIANVTTV